MTGTSRFVVNRVRSRPRTIFMAHDNIFGCQRPRSPGQTIETRISPSVEGISSKTVSLRRNTLTSTVD